MDASILRRLAGAGVEVANSNDRLIGPFLLRCDRIGDGSKKKVEVSASDLGGVWMPKVSFTFQSLCRETSLLAAMADAAVLDGLETVEAKRDLRGTRAVVISLIGAFVCSTCHCGRSGDNLLDGIHSNEN